MKIWIMLDESYQLCSHGVPRPSSESLVRSTSEKRGARIRPIMKFTLFSFSSVLIPAVLAILVVQAQCGWTATVISGNISGTWTTNQSPYIVTADATVPTNQVLSIQPGVTVIIGPAVRLWVYGGIL